MYSDERVAVKQEFIDVGGLATSVSTSTKEREVIVIEDD